VGHPDGTSEAYAFDALGRLSTRTCQDGSVCTTGHDLNGRVTTCSWSTAPGDTVTTTVADTTYQHDGLGRCTGSSQGGSVLVFAYDSLGNQTAETSNGSTVTRGFDHRGRTRITYPDGRMFAESRDAFGRLLAVAKVMGGNPVSPPIVSMQYLGMRVSKSTQANGVVTDYTYRANGDVAPPGEPDASFAACVRVTVRDAFSNVLTDKIVRRDANQRVTSEETAFSSVADAPGRTKSFTRDAAGRVTACDITRRETAGGPLIPESSVSYVLAKDGKRVSEVRNSVAGSYTQGSGDLEMGQYTTWPGGTGSIEWDDNGNLGIMPTATSQIAFAKNVQGRVVSVSDVTDPLNPVTLVSYDYDALGRCVSRSVDSPGGLSSEVTGFVFDGSVCIQELGDDGNGTINAAVTLVCGDGVRHCISTRNGTLFYPHGASTAVARESTGVFAMACTGGPDTVTNSTGAVTERFDHDDACKPIFLESNGQPASRTSAVGPLRWMAPETMWEPDINMHVGSGGDFYSPDLGMIVAKAKDTTSGVGKKEFKGHVTLLK
jgi:YD repeat-containing protein